MAPGVIELQAKLQAASSDTTRRLVATRKLTKCEYIILIERRIFFSFFLPNTDTNCVLTGVQGTELKYKKKGKREIFSFHVDSEYKAY